MNKYTYSSNKNKVDYTYKMNGKNYIVGVDLAKEDKKDYSDEYYMNFPSSIDILLREEN